MDSDSAPVAKDFVTVLTTEPLRCASKLIRPAANLDESERMAAGGDRGLVIDYNAGMWFRGKHPPSTTAG